MSLAAATTEPSGQSRAYGAFTQHLLTLNFAHRQAGGSGEYVG